MFNVNNKNHRTSCKICSKLTIKTPDLRHWSRSGAFIVNFKTHFTPCSSVFIVNFVQVNAGWVTLPKQSVQCLLNPIMPIKHKMVKPCSICSKVFSVCLTNL